MKTLKTILIIGLALCMLAGCAKAPAKEPEPAADNEVIVRKDQLCAFSAQYIRTDGRRESGAYPQVTIIHSVEELTSYYEENKGSYDLESREDATGFLDACEKYDSAYFKDSFLIVILMEEASGSIRHTVDELSLKETGELTASISTEKPEAGTADMAVWHILIAPEKGITAPHANQVSVLVDGVVAYENAKSKFDGDKGSSGTLTEVLEPSMNVRGEEYPISDSDNQALDEMLISLTYSPVKVCKCLPEFTVTTSSGTYGIHLNEGFARCEKGQADLTEEQIQLIRGIMEAAQIG